MEKHSVLGWLLITAVLSINSAFGEPLQATSKYRLSSGDMIRIDVFGEKSLSVQGKLTDAGTISYPFLGEVMAKGLTIGELGSAIAEQLKGPYLREPQVSVNILQYRDIYVNGQVAKPGNYPFVPGMNVLKAIAIAGGFTDRASRSRVQIIRDDTNKIEKAVSTDAGMQPGDIIIVDESFF